MSWSFYLVHILVNLHAEFISMFTLELFDLPGSFAGVRQTQTADLQTYRPADLQTCRLADLKTCRLADLQTRS